MQLAAPMGFDAAGMGTAWQWFLSKTLENAGTKMAEADTKGKAAVSNAYWLTAAFPFVSVSAILVPLRFH